MPGGRRPRLARRRRDSRCSAPTPSRSRSPSHGSRAAAPCATGPLPLARLWLTGSLGVAAAVGGQALLAGVTGDPAALGGGWLELAALCAAAGGVIALTLQVAPAAAELVRDLRPRAPRITLPAAPEPSLPRLTVHVAAAPRTPATAERAPPRS